MSASALNVLKLCCLDFDSIRGGSRGKTGTLSDFTVRGSFELVEIAFEGGVGRSGEGRVFRPTFANKKFVSSTMLLGSSFKFLIKVWEALDDLESTLATMAAKALVALFRLLLRSRAAFGIVYHIMALVDFSNTFVFCRSLAWLNSYSTLKIHANNKSQSDKQVMLSGKGLHFALPMLLLLAGCKLFVHLDPF